MNDLESKRPARSMERMLSKEEQTQAIAVSKSMLKLIRLFLLGKEASSHSNIKEKNDTSEM